MNKYQQTIENIEMSDEMKNRILKNAVDKYDSRKDRLKSLRWERFLQKAAIAVCCLAGIVVMSVVLIKGVFRIGGSKAANPNSTAGYSEDAKRQEIIRKYAAASNNKPAYGYAASKSPQDYSSSEIVLENEERYAIVFSNGEEENCQISKDTKNKGTIWIVPNNIVAEGFAVSNNNWERVLCENSTVMRFSNEDVMKSFTGIDASMLSLSQNAPRKYEFRDNGIATAYYDINNSIVLFSVTGSQAVSLNMLSCNDKMTYVETGRGDIAVADDSSQYFAAWWEENGFSYWIYSKNKLPKEWLTEVLEK